MNNQNQSKFNKGISTPIGILIIVVLAGLVGGILTWQFFKPEVKMLQKEVAPVKEEVKEPKEKLKDETAGWKIYRNEEYRFEFKYPENYKIISESIDDSFLKIPQSEICQIMYKIDLVNPALPKIIWEAPAIPNSNPDYDLPSIMIKVMKADCNSVATYSLPFPYEIRKVVDKLKSLGISQEKLYGSMFYGMTWFEIEDYPEIKSRCKPENLSDKYCAGFNCKDISVSKLKTDYFVIKNLSCHTGPIYPQTISSVIPKEEKIIISFEDEATKYQEDGSFDQILSTFKFIK